MDRRITLAQSAQRDLDSIELYLGKVASPRLAKAYVRRILTFIKKLQNFSERGSVRDDIRPGLRTIGFDRLGSIFFFRFLPFSNSHDTRLQIDNTGSGFFKFSQSTPTPKLSVAARNRFFG